MTDDESLALFGLAPPLKSLPEIRELLVSESSKERNQQGTGDTELIRLCCVQLFSAGQLEDALLIWSAKRASFDLGFGIDVQLLCGAGIDSTKEFLSSCSTVEAQEALAYIDKCLQAGDFEEFTPTSWLQFYRNYYGVE
jgi:hypothetical protein